MGIDYSEFLPECWIFPQCVNKNGTGSLICPLCQNYFLQFISYNFFFLLFFVVMFVPFCMSPLEIAGSAFLCLKQE